MHYRISRDDQEYGPYTFEELQQYVVEGSLFETDYVHNGIEWILLGRFLEDSQNSIGVEKSRPAKFYGIFSIILSVLCLLILGIPFFNIIVSGLAVVLGVVAIVAPLITKKRGISIPLVALVLSVALLLLSNMYTNNFIEERQNQKKESLYKN